ncbi:uncharacterized protein MYCFIDRAFT_173227 [Pseudocercospora fijiensis CIRAD86]|uniref:Uncharacterized protein n=1 Tax=Pseudocercospora fijiensis (strain CIRAD86) TaxID=383855 RepID=M3B4B9_PSEFD|nr:uncharacterized protein MYCFIDRAFT_173227 [Pseudocercospora fijiensis CIRAD86]EME84192.1 hypothetical protein MYCFIDRAFT_173227 [Pseudocercospora fijiensis CIRAD86]
MHEWLCADFSDLFNHNARVSKNFSKEVTTAAYFYSISQGKLQCEGTAAALTAAPYVTPEENTWLANTERVRVHKQDFRETTIAFPSLRRASDQEIRSLRPHAPDQ